jgi:hypothetical protein
MTHRHPACIAKATATVLAILLACPVPGEARSATCPAAGARYESNNFVRTSIVVSLGGDRDDTLGCRWRREEDGQVLWLEPDSPAMRPLGGAGPGANRTGGQPPAPEGGPERAGTGAGTVQNGVYECDAPANLAGGIVGAPQTGLMFGVMAPGVYRAFDGGRGTFRMEGNILVMASGPLSGTRYRRDGPVLFRPLDAAGQAGSIRCVLNRSKPVDGRW